ncbi:MAG: hypothetical protein M1814_006039 [Vezdaea aestivalis]|nr:MAG: hypothetical protein M1814_006039 [Vezdaea aestivalis]
MAWLAIQAVAVILCHAVTLKAQISIPDPDPELTRLQQPKCPSYAGFGQTPHGPYSEGIHKLPFQRPEKECRTFVAPEVEDAIERLRGKIKDKDLFRLFENAYPNTLDTAVKWSGFSNASGHEGEKEDLAFIITGDIDAMWLRDSANQILSYLPILRPSTAKTSLAALFRGVINAHSRYIKITPYCHAFQPPAESELSPANNAAYYNNHLREPYDRSLTFDCKWELDSLASFLELSTSYYNSTLDLTPFSAFTWLDTINTILDAVDAMRRGTFTPDGHQDSSAYTFEGLTLRGTETLSNGGIGNPTRPGTGLIRSAFRPSDDATVFQLFIPANMMFATQLRRCAAIAEILSSLPATSPSAAAAGPIASRMRRTAAEIDAGVQRYGIVTHPVYGRIYAYEVDGYGSANLMDDANTPSLLSLPLHTDVSMYDPVYRNTRHFALSQDNPYWMWGPVINGIGGPHVGPGKAWPLACIIRAFTTDDEDEAEGQIKSVLNSTDGLGLVHEAINTWDQSDWSRQW